jgi:hypothetical protein
MVKKRNISESFTSGSAESRLLGVSTGNIIGFTPQTAI